jgi:phospholipase C
VKRATTHAALLAVVGLLALLVLPGRAAAGAPAGTTTPIRHFVVLMQSGHSFDNYFGTYPGANGVRPGTCLPLDGGPGGTPGCVAPFRMGNEPPEDFNPTAGIQSRQFADGRMDGFVSAYRRQGRDGSTAMGYYDGGDLPFYWNVADRFTLFDSFFSSARVGTRLNYFYWVAGVPTPQGSERVPAGGYGDIPTIFDRLTDRGVPWKFYVEHLDRTATFRTRPVATARVPLLAFARFLDDPRLAGHVVDLSEYDRDIAAGTLPAVAYVVANGSNEQPPSRIGNGEDLVRHMTGELAKSAYWSSSAFLWTYDGWGGWYDHVAPPPVDAYGYGFRVPALMVSPYSRVGEVDHTALDYTGILRFIEDNWQLAPLGTRDAGSPGLRSAFDFAAGPRAPELLGAQRIAPPATTTRARWVVYSSYGGILLLAAAVATAPALLRRLRRPREVAS